MTWALIGLAAAAMAVAAVSIAATIWLAKRALGAADELVGALEQIGDLRRANDAFERTTTRLELALADSERRTVAEETARKLAEEQRDRATRRLAESGDPKAAAARMRADVGRLRTLADQNVPTGAPGEASD